MTTMVAILFSIILVVSPVMAGGSSDIGLFAGAWTGADARHRHGGCRHQSRDAGDVPGAGASGAIVLVAFHREGE